MLLLLTACKKTEEKPVTEESNQEQESVVQEQPEEEDTVQTPKKGGTLYMTIENQHYYNPLLETNSISGLNIRFRNCPVFAFVSSNGL